MDKKEQAEKAFDKLTEEMTNYVSIKREDNKTNARIWNVSNKYHSNRGASFWQTKILA